VGGECLYDFVIARLPIASTTRDPVRERLQDEFHPRFEIPNVPAVVIDVPVDSFLSKNRKSNALVLHVRRHFNAAKYIGLPDLVKLDRVAPPADFLSMFDAIDLESNPPDIGPWHLLEDTSFLLNDPSRHGNLPPGCDPSEFGTKWHQRWHQR
jgi:hypothetical protein